jgi:WD40 repeat protein
MKLKSCPSSEELQDYLAAVLDAAAEAVVSRHVEQCRRCQEKLDAFTSDLSGSGTHEDPTTADPPFLSRLKQVVLAEVFGASPNGGSRPTESYGGERSSDDDVPRVPGYEVLRRVARGGMGVVYEARQSALNRTVALKMILATAYDQDSNALIRFRLEGEMAARVRHPNVVQTHEVGTNAGRPYLVMEWVDGGTLRDYLGEGTPSPRTAAQQVETLARAVHAAHLQGVLHRDLKPANVFLTRATVLKIGDFGLARDLNAAERMTASGITAGTPDYMAPEQVEGRARDVGPGADIWALGAILYEMLTGRPPFEAETSMETLLQVCSQEPTPPRRTHPHVPRDLETICLKCLEKKPAARYVSAEALADDLRRFLDGRPILARHVGPLERGLKWCLRHRAASVMIVVTVLSLLAGTGLSTYFGLTAVERAEDAEKARDQARGAEAAADTQRRKSDRQAAQLLLERGLARAAEGKVAEALHWMVASLETSPDPEFQHLVRLHLGSWAGRTPTLRHWLDTRHKWAALRRDGSLLVTAGNGDSTDAEPPAALQFWDPRTGAKVGSPLRTGDLNIVKPSFNPAGDRVLTANGMIQSYQSKPGWAKVWGVAQRSLLARAEGHADFVEAVAWAPDGDCFATGSWDQKVIVWDLYGRPLYEPIRLPVSGRHLAFSPDRQLLLIAGDQHVQLWDPATGAAVGEPLVESPKPGLAFTGVAVSPDGRIMLATGGLLADNRYLVARRWNPTERQWIGEPVCITGLDPTGQVTFLADGRACAYAPNQATAEGDLLARVDNGVQLWRPARDLSRPVEDVTLFGRTKQPSLWEVIFARDGSRIWTGGDPRLAQAWDPATGRPVGAALEDGPIWDHSRMTVSPDGRFIATGMYGKDYAVSVWDAHTGQRIAPRLLHRNLPLVMALSPDGKLLATGGHFHELTVWDYASGKHIWQPLDQGDMITDLAFSPDGRFIAAATYRGEVRVVDVAARKLAYPPLKHFDKVFRTVFSPDGQRLLSQDLSTARLWDARTGRPIGEPMPCPPGDERRRWDLRAMFSPDSKILLLSSGCGSFRLWDGLTARPLGPQTPVRESQPSAFAFSPDSRLVIAGHEDGRAQLWDVATSLPLAAPYVQPAPVRGAAFAPDGRSVRTITTNGTVRSWPLPEPLAGEPERIRRALELRTGLAMDGSGNVSALSRAAWEEKRRLWSSREGAADWELIVPPDEIAWHDARAHDAEELGMSFTARWHLDRLLRRKPDDWLLYARRACTYTEEENWDRAEADYQHALERGGPVRLVDWYRCCAWVAVARGQESAAGWYQERIRRAKAKQE